MATLPQLTPGETAAIAAFIAEFPPKRLKKLGHRNWQAALYEAWLADWPEQRGDLRALRNSTRFPYLTDITRAYTEQTK